MITFKYCARSLVATVLLGAITVSSFSSAAAENKTINLGQVSLSFYAVTGGIVQHVLEKEGYKVNIVPGSHGQIYPKVGTGEVDILAASWLPSAHAGLYAKVEDSTFQLTKLYDNAKLFWVVPGYVPKSELATVEDLKKPEVKVKLDTNIVSLPESTGLTTNGRKVLTAYGLNHAGYSMEAAPPSKWISTFKSAVAEKKWVVFPLWQPQWINAVYDVRILEEPKGIYGEDNAYLIAHTSLKSKLSARALKHLANIKLSVAAVTEMDRLVNVEKMAPREASERWIAANKELVANWKPSMTN